MKALIPALFLLSLTCGTAMGQQTSLNEIRLGNQVWSTRNLSVETFRNGDPIPEAKTAEEWQKAAQLKIPVWCYYNNDPKMNQIYGKLYNWYAVSDPRGLAPEGWSIPDGVQWAEMVEWLGGKAKAGYALKSRKGWESNGNGTNLSNFNAQPAGGRYFDGAFEGLGQYANWWTSSELDEQHALDRNLNDGNASSLTYHSGKEDGFSVRCIKEASYKQAQPVVVKGQNTGNQSFQGSPQP